MDDESILRVRGRIDACRYASHDEDMKRPIILPKKFWLTDLIVTECHRKYKHQNHQTVMNEVQQKFDIPGLRSACHRVPNNCQKGCLRKAYPKLSVMNELPLARE